MFDGYHLPVDPQIFWISEAISCHFWGVCLQHSKFRSSFSPIGEAFRVAPVGKPGALQWLAKNDPNTGAMKPAAPTVRGGDRRYRSSQVTCTMRSWNLAPLGVNSFQNFQNRQGLIRNSLAFQGVSFVLPGKNLQIPLLDIQKASSATGPSCSHFCITPELFHLLMRGHDCGCPCRVPSAIVSYRATFFLSLMAPLLVASCCSRYKHPIFIYIPKHGELRGGAWVVGETQGDQARLNIFGKRMKEVPSGNSWHSYWKWP